MVKEETTTVWECPFCHVYMEMTDPQCLKCLKSLDILELVHNKQIDELLVEVKVSQLNQLKPQ